MSTERSTYVDRLPETLTLKSRDGQEFEVKKEAALQMGIVRGMFGVLDEDPDDVISIEEVDGTILQKVIDFCCFQVRRKMEDMSAEEVQDWERNYTRTDTGTLLKILRVRLTNLFFSSARNPNYSLEKCCSLSAP